MKSTLHLLPLPEFGIHHRLNFRVRGRRQYTLRTLHQQDCQTAAESDKIPSFPYSTSYGTESIQACPAKRTGASAVRRDAFSVLLEGCSLQRANCSFGNRRL